MTQKRLKLRPLTRSDIILRNALEKNLQAHTCYKNHGQLQYYRTIRTGNDTSSPLVTDIVEL